MIEGQLWLGIISGTLGARNAKMREELFPVSDLEQTRRELAKMQAELVGVRGPSVTGRRELRPEETARAIQLEERIRLLEEQPRRLTPNTGGSRTYVVPGADTSYRPEPDRWASLGEVTEQRRAAREEEQRKQTELLKKIAENTGRPTPAILVR